MLKDFPYNYFIYICRNKIIVANGLQPYAVGAFNHCTNLKAQNYE
jgi:hypothetical protein